MLRPQATDPASNDLELNEEDSIAIADESPKVATNQSTPRNITVRSPPKNKIPKKYQNGTLLLP